MDEARNEQPRKPVSVPWVVGAPARGERLVMMTAYDFSQARLVEQAGADIVLVGDSLAMVVLGHNDTLSVTVDEMLHHVPCASSRRREHRQSRSKGGDRRPWPH